MPRLGNHITMDLYECDPAKLNDVGYIRASLEEAARLAGAKIVGRNFHRFEPHGVTGVVVVRESHIAIHTWPEYEFAAVDIFLCGDKEGAEKAREHIILAREAGEHEAIQVTRGQQPLHFHAIANGKQGIQ